MATFFKEPYKKYYDKLSGSTSILASAQSVAQDSKEASVVVSRLQSQLSGSFWRELGYEEIVANSVPLLKINIDSFTNDINKVLVAACDKSINVLLPLLTTFKEKDELYESKEASLSSLNSNAPQEKYKSEYNKETKEYKLTNEYTDAYSAYLQDKKNLENDIASLKSELDSLKTKVDTAVEEIKSLNGTAQQVDSVATVSDVSTNSNLLSTGEVVVNKDYAALASVDTSDDVVSLSSDSFGKTILYNDVGGYEYGYSRKILTSHGKYVTVFQQAWNNKSSKYKYTDIEDDPKSLSSSGCGYNALASIMSSKYPDITPEQLFLEMGRKSLYASDIKTHLETNYGIKVGYRDDFIDATDKKNKIVSEVMKGNMVICTVDARTDTKYTKQGHWVAIVDYDPENDTFYVTDSNDQDDSNAPPIDATRFLRDYEQNSNIIYIADDSGYKERS